MCGVWGRCRVVVVGMVWLGLVCCLGWACSGVWGGCGGLDVCGGGWSGCVVVMVGVWGLGWVCGGWGGCVVFGVGVVFVEGV